MKTRTALGGYCMYNETPKLAFMPAEMRVHVINAHVDEVSLQQSRDYGRGAER